MISVLIPTFNRRNVLERTLPTLFQQDFPADRFEIVVVVDGSSDGTMEFLRKLASPCSIHIVEQPHQGAAAARNAGLKRVRGELVLFLDDDILCPPNLLSLHASAHHGQSRRVVFGPIHTSITSAATLATDWTKNASLASTEMLNKGLTPGIGNLRLDPNSSISIDFLSRVGTFDENFESALETAEIALRLQSAGAEFFYLRNATVDHVFAKTSAQLAREDAFCYGRKDVLLSRKHPQYRPESVVGRVAEGGVGRSALRRVAATFAAFDRAIALPLWLCERFRQFTPFRRLGVRLLGQRKAVNFWRGARAEAGSWRTLEQEFGKALPVLMYHHIGPATPGTYPELTVSPRRFEQHLQWLIQLGYRGITPSKWQGWRTAGHSLPDKPVLLTFDDAYADTATYAFPLLKRYGFPAAVFVVASEVGGTNRWDQNVGSYEHRVMDLGQIVSWVTEGIAFGAHSLTHADLTAIPEADVREETVRSGELLAGLIGAPVSTFAYPYGFFNANAEAAARSRYDLAFSTEEGLNTLATNPHRLRRTMVLPDDGYIDFVSRLRLGYSPRRRVIAGLARLRRVWMRRGG
jgi:peptidoglycan/xylan/chitin deacetylase (PgdA/CDA1 family)/glycosyltransferase involved in cell wall biosynthesis